MLTLDGMKLLANGVHVANVGIEYLGVLEAAISEHCESAILLEEYERRIATLQESLKQACHNPHSNDRVIMQEVDRLVKERDDLKRKLENAEMLIERLKRPGQSDLEAAEKIMPRLQGITQELGVKTLVLSQMSMASKSDQLKGAVGGHSKGGDIIEELAHAEIELLRDAPSAEGEGHKIIATVTKTRRGISGASFSLDYRGRSMEFTGRSQRVERNKDRKPLFSSVNILRSGS